MGNCVSSAQDREEKAKSDAIDRQIEEDSRKFRKECKILLLGTYLPFYFTLCLFHCIFMIETNVSGLYLLGLYVIRSTPSPCRYCSYPTLGSGESGKSTIVKQMKIIHQNGFTESELMTFRPTIYRNTLDSAQAIVLQMRNMNVECVTPANRVRSLSLYPLP
jgi:guanine nucleotide-binding protein G(i) subunit alpha